MKKIDFSTIKMEEQQHTDKALLAKGIKYMASSLLFIVVGPGTIYQAFKNQGHPYYLPVLIVGLCAAALAIFMVFKGLKTIMSAIFRD